MKQYNVFYCFKSPQQETVVMAKSPTDAVKRVKSALLALGHGDANVEEVWEILP